MGLAKSIKNFRQLKGISQEHMGEKLNMSQATYSRLENTDTKCSIYLPQIAEALNTTPELLHQYHKDSYVEIEALLEKQLAEKEDIIRSQAVYIQFLNHFIDHTWTVLRNYLGESI